MFFFFSKVLTIFLFPLPLVIFSSILISFIIKERKKRIIILSPILVLWFFSSPPISQFLLKTLEHPYPPMEMEKIPTSDVIVVLGGMINPLTAYPEKPELLSSADRLTDAVILFNQKKAGKILFTGGSGVLFQQDVEEASNAKKIMVDLGVPEESILIENKSRNTYENARYSLEILKQNKLESVILITSAFHMKRSLGVFKKQGIKVFAFPTDYKSLKPELNWDMIVPSTGGLDASTIVIKEWMGILAYKIKGYL
ncbi:MAG: YdcF family protein [Leptospiraceae bacterium]|nr:YdcF family protein [Leptospiraceae bacterium]